MVTASQGTDQASGIAADSQDTDQASRIVFASEDTYGGGGWSVTANTF